MTIGVRSAMEPERSASGPGGETVPDAGGIGVDPASGATRWRSRRVRPAYPATAAPTMTEPDRTRNDRRDQSGIPGVRADRATRALIGPVVVPMASDPSSAVVAAPSRSQPSTQIPIPIETAAAAPAIAADASGSRSAARNPTTPKPTKTATAAA